MVEEQQLDRHIDTIAQWILESNHLVAFTGAGISTDSGLPDFRGPSGVWTRRDAGLPPPRVEWDRVRPNASHLALVELQRLGKLQLVITQNVDNLHRESGIDPSRLAELHGNVKLMRCLGCGDVVSQKDAGWDEDRWGLGFLADDPLVGQPDCPTCGGRLVSTVVNFGDPMPEKELSLAEEHARECDLMLVLGSSLTVEPAASLVGRALRTGAAVVLVNQGETPYDRTVTLRVSAGIGEVLPPAVERLKRALEDKSTPR